MPYPSWTCAIRHTQHFGTNSHSVTGAHFLAKQGRCPAPGFTQSALWDLYSLRTKILGHIKLTWKILMCLFMSIPTFHPKKPQSPELLCHPCPAVVAPEWVVGVRVVAADARRHVAVTQPLASSAARLIGSHGLPAHLEDVGVQQLVQDGCRANTFKNHTGLTTRSLDRFPVRTNGVLAHPWLWTRSGTHTGRAQHSLYGWWDKRCRSDSRSEKTAGPVGGGGKKKKVNSRHTALQHILYMQGVSR